ncbi:MAG: SipW-dependent-type signal peptide-containing protein, partial [Lachnospiraceae bacterium]
KKHKEVLKMTNSKSTKRSLIASAMAMLMCVTMLIGTTFAWFTDTASTAVNKIQAGTLNIDLEMKGADGNWVTAEGQSLSFKKAAGAPAGEAILWEPGCTYELPELRIVNKGNLALKYKIVVNGVNGDAKLLEAIDFTYGNGIDISVEGHLKPNETATGIVMKGHMREGSGNEYQGLAIDGIGITVYATQDTVEYDSYKNTYDDIAFVSSAQELGDALTKGGGIVLAADITFPFGHVVPKGINATVDLNGKKITGVSTNADVKQQTTFIKVEGELTVVNGTIEVKHAGDQLTNSSHSAFEVRGTLNLGKDAHIKNLGETNAVNSSNSIYLVADLLNMLSQPVVNIDGATVESTNIPIRIFNNTTDQPGSKDNTATVNVNSGTISSTQAEGIEIWIQNSATAIQKDAIVNIADTYKYDVTPDGTSYNFK